MLPLYCHSPNHTLSTNHLLTSQPHHHQSFTRQVRRQASLTESMRRIESGLTTRVEEEKATLMQDRDTLSKALEGLRKQAADRSLVDDERVRALEDDLREARTRADEKTLQASAAREELVGQLFDTLCWYSNYQHTLIHLINTLFHPPLRKVREQGISQAARERSAILERQLTIAQERLGVERGVQVLDSALATEAAERDVALDRAVAEIENLKQRLAAAEGTPPVVSRVNTSIPLNPFPNSIPLVPRMTRSCRAVSSHRGEHRVVTQRAAGTLCQCQAGSRGRGGTPSVRPRGYAKGIGRTQGLGRVDLAGNGEGPRGVANGEKRSIGAGPRVGAGGRERTTNVEASGRTHGTTQTRHCQVPNCGTQLLHQLRTGVTAARQGRSRPERTRR